MSHSTDNGTATIDGKPVAGRDTPGASPTAAPGDAAAAGAQKHKRGRRWLGRIFKTFLLLAVLLGVARIFMPSTITWYVNRVIDQSPLYDGRIGGIDVHLYRGAYSIQDIRLNKVTGSVPVPLFAAKRVDLAISWDALFHGKVVGRVEITQPELNFVDGPNDPGDADGGGGDAGGGAGDMTGAGGPWLQMLQDLFPFQINRVLVKDGSVHFRTYPAGEKPVDVYLSELSATVDNLTNIQDEVTPLITTVKANALAMDHAKFEYQMKLDPFSYKPTFHMMTRLLALDVTKVNDLTRTYGSFDFEHGWFDLVIELDSKEGQLRGYVKPLFRNLKIISGKDVEEDNVFQVFWEALVGTAQEVLENQRRDQFGTLIPFTGDVSGPKPDILGTIGNVLRNGFVRAYLPKLQNGGGRDAAGLQFEPPTLTDPVSVGDP